MINILIVFGTRPEIIKIAPVVKELRKYPDKYRVILCNTEQQKDLTQQMLRFEKIKTDYSFNVMTHNQTLSETQNKILTKLSKIKEKIDMVLVQGDTLSAFCGALFSYYFQRPLFHLEAGLRSNDIFQPFPEEGFRKMISCIATLHLAPTKAAKMNLKNEGIQAKKIYITGNTVIDAVKNIIKEKSTINHIKLNPLQKNILITVHRRENFVNLESIVEGISKIAHNFKDFKIIIPVHPNPNVKNFITEHLQQYKNILLVNPLSYPDLINIMKNSRLVLTDSGGIQEEACYLGCNLLILRNKTERKEIITERLGQLVGTKAHNIYEKSKKILEKTSFEKKHKTFIFGNGRAAIKIEKIIAKYFHLPN